MPIDLIIFDCDGVLVDSEVISCQAHADVLTRHGYPITAEQVSARFLGRATKQANLEIESELGRKLPEAYHGDLQDELFRAFEADLEAIRGIHDVLDVVTQAVCVASSGSHERMRVSLGCTSLYERFALNIFSSSQVANGKPAPDLFLFAAREMGVSPERCVVVEDSLAGIAGARAAGMKVFGFYGGSHCGAGHAETLRQAGADLTFADMHQLPELVRRVAADALAG
ncbi:HAD family hydrolase [Bradyrhizobium sp. INPA01-394B]|uniref:HAD family hydrolase n=1 Tax=Bradyrhizobium campsiandrae TaxID=1729892 RepID=A0ABR7UEL7_9BRAD|nr:HAD family hydrolase [Bradyrhizobium campsiandrae]MBC9878096.1 HAD family hydrolase [Bradyrhizobium campsiandrae]MBC9981628.1 HAD family hydrolase [Bradyrhizobium campsiandrae]